MEFKKGINNIMFLRPPVSESDPRYAPALESLGIEYIVSYCRHKQVPCSYYDCNLQDISVEQICKLIHDEQPILLCITITTEKIRAPELMIMEYISKLKHRPLVCVGGHFVSYAYNEVLNDFINIDIVSIGEGELTTVNLYRAIVNKTDFSNVGGIAYRKDGKIIFNKNDMHKIDDLNALPWPARDHTKLAVQKSHLFCIISSRGCYGKCNFCAINSFTKRFNYRKCRVRNINDVVAEIDYAILNLGAYYILFCDDNFMLRGQAGLSRIKSLIESFREKNIVCEFGFFCRCDDILYCAEVLSDLVSVGLRHVFLGVESFSQRPLDFYNKDLKPDTAIAALELCRKHKINTEIGFIMFDPYVSIDEIINNINFLKHLKLNSFFKFNTKLSVYFGSELIDILRKDGLLVKDRFDIKYNYKNLGIDTIEELVNSVYNFMLPLSSLFYDLKGCLTISWYKKDSDEIKELLDIEQSINNHLTDMLLEKIECIQQNHCTWTINDKLKFLCDAQINFKREISAAYYLAKNLHSY